MTWIKTEVDERVNNALEEVKERFDMNKSEAALYLLREGTKSYENKNIVENTDA